MDEQVIVADTNDQADVEEYLEDELLVEEISIDGMCGVY
jgi:mycofactocin precursor